MDFMHARIAFSLHHESCTPSWKAKCHFFFVLWNSPLLEQVSITCLDDITLALL